MKIRLYFFVVICGGLDSWYLQPHMKRMISAWYPKESKDAQRCPKHQPKEPDNDWLITGEIMNIYEDITCIRL